MTNTPGLLSSSSICEKEICNEQGEKLGEIKDLMIDLHDNCVEYAVLEFDYGFLNMKEKLFAIPLDAFTLDTDSDKLILNVTEEKLKNAPGFDKDNWPNMANSTFEKDIYNYYGYTRHRTA